MPATGAIARTMTNIRNGGRTPVAGIVHAATLLLITLVFAKWAALIPLACLAAILSMIAFHMFEWRSFVSMLRSQRGEMLVMVTTFLLTVIIDLTVAIEVGMVLAAFLFMKRMSEVTNVAVFRREISEDDELTVATPRTDIPKGVEVYEINGPFFFGAVYKFKEAMNIVEKAPRVRIIRMARVSSMDTTGLRALEEVFQDGKKHGTALIIAEIHAQPFVAMMKSDLVDRFGEKNVLATFEEALNRARIIIDEHDGHGVTSARRVDY
jgi:SulP family sulfate permease